MAIQEALTGVVSNVTSAVAGIGDNKIIGQVKKSDSIARSANARADAIKKAKQQQMARVRAFKAKYKDFGGKVGYMSALSSYKSEQRKKEG